MAMDWKMSTIFSCLVLLACLSHYHSVQGGECRSVEVTGSLYHQGTDGIYFRDGSGICNARNVWVQETGNHHLYYIQDGYDGWFIGPWSCHWGNFLISSKSTAEEPYDAKETWKEVEGSTAVWRNNSYFLIRCYDHIKYNNVSNCQQIPCQNGGSCIKVSDRYTCSCPRRYFGQTCETKIDANHCKSFPCLNGATCIDLENDFECKCDQGFSGRQCDIEIDPIDCTVEPCQEHCTGKDGSPCIQSRGSAWGRLFAFFGAIFVVFVLIILLLFTAKCIKQYCVSRDNKSSTTSDESWKDFSYAKLDSTKSLDKLSFA